MNKKLILLAAFLAFTLMPTGRVGADDKKEVKIGFIATLSGPRASLGEDALNGAKLALSAVNAEADTKLTLAIEDSQGDAKTGINAYRKLTAQGLKMVLTQNSNISLPISELVNKDGVIQLAFSTTSDAYSKPDDFTFRVNGTTVCEAEVMGSFLSREVKKKQGNIAVLSMEDEYPAAFRKNLESEFKKRDLSLALSDTFLPKETDFRSVIARLKEKHIDYAVLISYPTEAGVFLKQAKELGFKPSFMLGNSPVNNKEFFDTAGSASDGLILSYENVASNGPIAAKYRELYKRTPTWFAATGYDAVAVAALALKTCNYEADSSCLKKALYSIKDFEGLTGRKGFDDVYGDMNDTCKLLISKGGQFVDYAGERQPG